jgi:hypothetical protein
VPAFLASHMIASLILNDDDPAVWAMFTSLGDFPCFKLPFFIAFSTLVLSCGQLAAIHANLSATLTRRFCFILALPSNIVFTIFAWTPAKVGV